MPYYPKDPKIFLKEENPGIRLTSLLGNTNSYLIVCSEMKEVIASYCQDVEVEYLPFALYDHRKRLYSRDYFIINPIGSHDCLNEKASGVEYGPEGGVVRIAQLVLDAAKLNNLPPFFRIDKQRTTYVVSEPLAQSLKDRGFTNIQLEPLAISASA
ncbi:hypothetical protein F0U60_42800 [Archangium minus]|uniref:Immunity MXAN-0049 protein domain-containing protein n=2 Tax=Archangium minus TaxID=83450 RepID=A0ABY9X407_9BACT|nr:hypothetical protein F0U60_42800 [Archangium minus]